MLTYKEPVTDVVIVDGTFTNETEVLVVNLLKKMLRKNFSEKAQLDEPIRITRFPVQSILITGASENSVRTADPMIIVSSNHTRPAYGPSLLDIMDALNSHFDIKVYSEGSTSFHPKKI
jgi:hypothetical protein